MFLNEEKWKEKKKILVHCLLHYIIWSGVLYMTAAWILFCFCFRMEIFVQQPIFIILVLLNFLFFIFFTKFFIIFAMSKLFRIFFLVQIKIVINIYFFPPHKNILRFFSNRIFFVLCEFRIRNRRKNKESNRNSKKKKMIKFLYSVLTIVWPSSPIKYWHIFFVYYYCRWWNFWQRFCYHHCWSFFPNKNKEFPQWKF